MLQKWSEICKSAPKMKCASEIHRKSECASEISSEFTRARIQIHRNFKWSQSNGRKFNPHFRPISSKICLAHFRRLFDTFVQKRTNSSKMDPRTFRSNFGHNASKISEFIGNFPRTSKFHPNFIQIHPNFNSLVFKFQPICIWLSPKFHSSFLDFHRIFTHTHSHLTPYICSHSISYHPYLVLANALHMTYWYIHTWLFIYV